MIKKKMNTQISLNPNIIHLFFVHVETSMSSFGMFLADFMRTGIRRQETVFTVKTNHTFHLDRHLTSPLYLTLSEIDNVSFCSVSKWFYILARGAGDRNPF